MKRFFLTGAFAAALTLSSGTAAFAHSEQSYSGRATGRVAHHQQNERERLHAHQKLERRRLAQDGLTWRERIWLRDHQKAERQRLKQHQKNERERLRDWRRGW